MDDIAAEASTSKPVFYRHFGDRAGLYQAVVDWVQEYILENLPLDDVEHVEPSDLVRGLADSYLGLVERDPDIYQFVITRPTGDVPDPVLGITTRIGNEVSTALRSWLERHGLSTEPANIWGHGVVGFVWAVADRWIITNMRRPRAEVVSYIDQFTAPTFTHHQSLTENTNHARSQR